MFSDPNRLQLEQQLLSQLQTRHKRTMPATMSIAASSESIGDLGVGNPDGAQALRNALAGERNALQAYVAAVRAFSNFILRGKMPDSRQQSSV
jgi:hypothetical protein